MTCNLRSGQVQKLERLWKLPFCMAITHAVGMGKFFKDCKMSELATLINSCLYETNKYVKVHYIRYNEEICSHNDDFSHVTLDTLALQYSSVNLGIIGSSSCISAVNVVVYTSVHEFKY